MHTYSSSDFSSSCNAAVAALNSLQTLWFDKLWAVQKFSKEKLHSEEKDDNNIKEMQTDPPAKPSLYPELVPNWQSNAWPSATQKPPLCHFVIMSGRADACFPPSRTKSRLHKRWYRMQGCVCSLKSWLSCPECLSDRRTGDILPSAFRCVSTPTHLVRINGSMSGMMTSGESAVCANRGKVFVF